MIRIQSNIKVVAGRIKKQLEVLKNKEYLLRPVATEVIPLMTERIHQKGEASDNAQIGTYNNSYLKLRQKKYKRDASSKIIVSLTRQLENNWAVIATQNGYGIGFLNPFNLQKARWVEENKGKKIFTMSKSEQQYAVDRINELISDALS
jgi:phage gpG-like protein